MNVKNEPMDADSDVISVRSLSSLSPASPLSTSSEHSREQHRFSTSSPTSKDSEEPVSRPSTTNFEVEPTSPVAIKSEAIVKSPRASCSPSPLLANETCPPTAEVQSFVRPKSSVDHLVAAAFSPKSSSADDKEHPPSSISKLESFVAALEHGESCASVISTLAAVPRCGTLNGGGGGHGRERRIPTPASAVIGFGGSSADPLATPVSSSSWFQKHQQFAALSVTAEEGPEGAASSRMHFWSQQDSEHLHHQRRRAFTRSGGEEPLDLSAKKAWPNDMLLRHHKSNDDDDVIQPKTSSRPRLDDSDSVLDKPDAVTTSTKAAANSLACLERDFGENSTLLNRIGSLSQLQRVKPSSGLAAFVAQQNVRLTHQDRQHSMHRAGLLQPILFDQQLCRQAVPAAARPPNDVMRHQQQHRERLPPVTNMLHPTSGTTRCHTQVASNSMRTPSMIGKLLSIGTGPNAASDNRNSWSNTSPFAAQSVDSDDRRAADKDRPKSHQYHHHHHHHHKLRQLSEAAIIPNGGLLNSKVYSATPLKCLECNGLFASLPELTMHMVNVGHYANIIRTDNGISQAYDDNGPGRHAGGGGYGGNWGGLGVTVSATAAGLDAATMVSPSSRSVDNGSVSSAESGSISPTKSPISFSSSPLRAEEHRDDTGDDIVAQMLHRQADPLIAGSLYEAYSELATGQRSFPYDEDLVIGTGGCGEKKASVAAVAAFDIVIRSMQKYIESRMKRSALDQDWQTIAAASPQQFHHKNCLRDKDRLRFNHSGGKIIGAQSMSSSVPRKDSSSSTEAIVAADTNNATRQNSTGSRFESKKRQADNNSIVIPEKKRAVGVGDGTPRPSNIGSVGADRGSSSLTPNVTPTTSSNRGRTSSVNVVDQPSMMSGNHQTSLSNDDVGIVCSSTASPGQMTELSDRYAAVGGVYATPTPQRCVGGVPCATDASSAAHRVAVSSPQTISSAAVPREDNEYASRFGKYCRLARELAGRAN